MDVVVANVFDAVADVIGVVDVEFAVDVDVTCDIYSMKRTYSCVFLPICLSFFYLPPVLLRVRVLSLRIYHVQWRSIVATRQNEDIRSFISITANLLDHQSFDSFHRMECPDYL